MLVLPVFEHSQFLTCDGTLPDVALAIGARCHFRGYRAIYTAAASELATAYESS